MQESEPYIITKRRTVRKILWGRIFAAICVVCLLVMGVVLWCSRSPRTLTAKARTYCVVTVGEYADLGKASAQAETAARAGGAGYLLGETTYAVAVACYADRKDADTVCERLLSSGEAAQITEVSCGSVTLEKPKSDADVVKKMLMRPPELFDELYAVSVQTDTKEISEAAAKYAALKMHVACVEYAGTCGNLHTDVGDYLSELFLSLADSLQTPANASENVSASLKYALCDMAVKICTQTDAFREKIKIGNEKKLS